MRMFIFMYKIFPIQIFSYTPYYQAHISYEAAERDRCNLFILMFYYVP